MSQAVYARQNRRPQPPEAFPAQSERRQPSDIGNTESAGAASRHIVHGRSLLSEQRRTRVLVDEAVEALTRGEMVIVVGDRHSGFVGALVTPADVITSQTVNFLVTFARGPLYTTIDSDLLDALGLEMIRGHSATLERAAVHVPVDYRHGTTTGLSAADRAATIRALADPRSTGADFRVPGHVPPIGGRPGGVLRRPGHTEAAVDLVRMAGHTPASATCSILSEDGSTATVAEIAEFADRHGLIVLRIADVVAYRRDREDVITRVGETMLPLPEGRFVAVGYADRFEDGEHMALVAGDLDQPGPIMIRVHIECLAGDAFRSNACGCQDSLRESIRAIGERGRGVLLYVRPPGGGRARIRHIEPPIEPDLGEIDDKAAETAVNGVALSMLRDLGISSERRLAEPSADVGR
jgi:3,4-dihydroxy 2-butanone 4-phosphate synthase / GTP cyclohydrolase II